MTIKISPVRTGIRRDINLAFTSADHTQSETRKQPQSESDYLLYRGRCRELSEQAVAADPTLRLVRGYYLCPVWGKQSHWWCERVDGTVVDPTVRQFPTAGVGAEYVEFDGTIDCEHCGKSVHEQDAYKVEHHAYCSDECYARDIGF